MIMILVVVMHACGFCFTVIGVHYLFMQVIVGVHNDESYFKLKKKQPIDNTEKRMEKVKKYADQVHIHFLLY